MLYRDVGKPWMSELEAEELTTMAAEMIQQPIKKLRDPDFRGLHRERWLITLFLWEAGASKSQIARQLHQHHTTPINALWQLDKILKSSQATWWRGAVDRLHRVAGTCQSKLRKS